MKNMWWLAGVISGVSLVLIVIFVRKLTKKNTGEYDERQIAARGVAYKYGFFAMMLYEFIYGMLAAAGVRRTDEAIGAILGIFVGVTVFGVTAIVKDAYLTRNDTPKQTAVSLALVTLGNLLVGIGRLLAGEVVADGVLTIDSVNLVCTVMFLIIGAVGVIHWLRGRKDEISE